MVNLKTVQAVQTTNQPSDPLNGTANNSQQSAPSDANNLKTDAAEDVNKNGQKTDPSDHLVNDEAHATAGYTQKQTQKGSTTGSVRGQQTTVQSQTTQYGTAQPTSVNNNQLPADKLTSKANKQQANKQQSAAHQLPQTDERQNSAATLWGSAMLLGVLGLFGLKRKKRHN